MTRIPNKEPAINEILSKFWVIEEVNGKKGEWSTEAHECEKLFKSTTKHNSFVVQLPIKENTYLGESYTTAKN